MKSILFFYGVIKTHERALISKMMTDNLPYPLTLFLRLGNFDSKMLWQYVTTAVCDRDTQNGVIILDDSIEDKPYIDEKELNYWDYFMPKASISFCVWFATMILVYQYCRYKQEKYGFYLLRVL